MQKLTKGALTMVLVGAVTFSITNTLLADHSGMLSTLGKTFTHSGHHKTANDTKQAEKAVKDGTRATDVNDVKTTLSDNNSLPQAVSNNDNKSEQDMDISQKNTTTISTPSTAANTAAPATNTAAATGIAPVTNTAPAKNTTTAAASTAANSNSTVVGAASTKSTSATAPAASTTTTTTTTNHGQQTSQAAKLKAAARKG